MLGAWIHGALLSIGLILPIGMQNSAVLTQGSAHQRWRSVLPAVLTAGMCDTLLIALAVVGVSGVALQIEWLRYSFGLLGVVFLLVMGVSVWRTKQANEAFSSSAWPARRQVVYTATVSLLNPHAIIDTLVVIGGSALMYTRVPERIAFGVACAMVSWVWFIALSLIGHLGGRAVLLRSQTLLPRVSALMMWGSALYLAFVVLTLHTSP
ncbi:MAG: LysE family transporter [Firmicutes bacterium]|nr:LysE family transporter [Bacillota bacterium]